jgi:subtilase family serine protease
LITRPIDPTQMITLRGNVRADLKPEHDLGLAEDGLEMRLQVVLRRSPERQADLDNLIARQQQPTAEEFHKWLTPEQFGERFGASQQDIATISAWLEGQGMRIESVLNNASMIDVTATAGQIRTAFRTEIHYHDIQGGKYPANVQDPRIPAALAPAIAGIHGLSAIPPRHTHTPIVPVAYDGATHTWHKAAAPPSGERPVLPDFADGSGGYEISPRDLYTIYNVTPMLTAANYGAGASVAVPEPVDMNFGTVNSTTGAATGGDVALFRSTFGVGGTLNMHVYHGYGTVTCGAPGTGAAGEGEANLDAEWANALAPSANLIFMSCANANGGLTQALAALVDNNLGDAIGISWDSSETGATAGGFSTRDTLFAQAAAQGQTIFVAAGDSGDDTKDQNSGVPAVNGINVSAWASSPLITAAGGTDFSDLYDDYMGGPAQSTYWSATNSAHYADALGYVPETAWNDSCASSLLASLQGYTDPAAYCATGSSIDGAVGGGGGYSVHYAQPSWQAGTPGLSASATMRAMPDISLFAGPGTWGHSILVCDTTSASTNCSSSSAFGAAGGTSFVAPQLTGIAGLLVSYTGSRQGVWNPTLYALAKAQFTAPATATSCYSNGQTANAGVTTGLPAASCIFNDVTTGNNDEPCKSGSLNCYVNTGATYGLLSTTGAASETIAYPAGIGYDLATGLGTINVTNLITHWNQAFTSTTQLGAVPTSITSSQSTVLKATVTTGTPAGYVDTPPALTGSVNFSAGSTALGSCVLSAGTCSLTVPAPALQVGSNSVTATYAGSGTYPASTSSIVTVTRSAAIIVTPQVTATAFVYNRATKLYNSTFTVKNTTGSAIAGPIELVLTGLNAGVTLANAAGTFQGSPYLTTAGPLAAGASVSLSAQISDPTSVSILALPIVYSGSF